MTFLALAESWWSTTLVACQLTARTNSIWLDRVGSNEERHLSRPNAMVFCGHGRRARVGEKFEAT
jgi:hypothetical protein